MSKVICVRVEIGAPYIRDDAPALDVKVVTEGNEVLSEGVLKPPTYNWGQFEVRSYSSYGYGLSPRIGNIKNMVGATDKKYATNLLKGLAALAIPGFIPEGYVDSSGKRLSTVYTKKLSFNYYDDDDYDDDDEDDAVREEVGNWDKFIDMCYEFIINDYQID